MFSAFPFFTISVKVSNSGRFSGSVNVGTSEIAIAGDVGLSGSVVCRKMTEEVAVVST